VWRTPTQHHGRITKRGSKLGRLVLIQCTLTAKRFSPYLRQYYERIKGRLRQGADRGGAEVLRDHLRDAQAWVEILGLSELCHS
jgi:transposase